MAATNTRFVDQMGAQYNLQMGQIKDLHGNIVTGTENKIEIISYDIWTRADYLNKKCTIDQIGDRKGTFKVLETITFNAEGTEAYSNLIIGNTGAKNILGDRGDNDENTIIIDAHHFTYNRIWDDSSKQYGEVFDWHIGNITESTDRAVF